LFLAAIPGLGLLQRKITRKCEWLRGTVSFEPRISRITRIGMDGFWKPLIMRINANSFLQFLSLSIPQIRNHGLPGLVWMVFGNH